MTWPTKIASKWIITTPPVHHLFILRQQTIYVLLGLPSLVQPVWACLVLIRKIDSQRCSQVWSFPKHFRCSVYVCLRWRATILLSDQRGNTFSFGASKLASGRVNTWLSFLVIQIRLIPAACIVEIHESISEYFEFFQSPISKSWISLLCLLSPPFFIHIQL